MRSEIDAGLNLLERLLANRPTTEAERDRIRQEVAHVERLIEEDEMTHPGLYQIKPWSSYRPLRALQVINAFYLGPALALAAIVLIWAAAMALAIWWLP
jgi:hypothetical protein